MLSGSYLPSGHRLHTLSELSCLNFPAGQGKQPRKLSAVLTGPHGVSAVGGLNFPASHKLICPYPAFEIVFENTAKKTRGFPATHFRGRNRGKIAGKSRESAAQMRHRKTTAEKAPTIQANVLWEKHRGNVSEKAHHGNPQKRCETSKMRSPRKARTIAEMHRRSASQHG